MNDTAIADRVAVDSPGSVEIGFELPRLYNASQLLFDNIGRGDADKVAIYAESGNVTYGELCEQASRTGNALQSLNLDRGDRIMLMLDDIPAYPAILFGAIRAGFVPMLINTLSPQDLVKFYLEDSGAKVVIVEGRTAPRIVADLVDCSDLAAIIQVDAPRPREQCVPPPARHAVYGTEFCQAHSGD